MFALFAVFAVFAVFAGWCRVVPGGAGWCRVVPGEAGEIGDLELKIAQNRFA